jgi:hypothetical protein
MILIHRQDRKFWYPNIKELKKICNQKKRKIKKEASIKAFEGQGVMFV